MSDCILADGAPNNTGYHSVWLEGKRMGAHRAAYIRRNGPIPDGLDVMRSCDNRRCVNPDHLTAGTRSDNMQGCVGKGRHFAPDSSGEANRRAKITPEDAMTIRELRGELAQKEIGKMYGLHQTTVSDIQRGKLWRE